MSDPRRTRLALESLEVREVPAVVTVTGVGDTIARDGAVTLREAITAANTRKPSGDAQLTGTGPVVIKFNIPGSGAHVIKPKSALPALAGGVTLDATTEPGYKGTPLIRLDGTQAGPKSDGLVLNGNNNVVRGLAIGGFRASGVYIPSDGNTVAGCWIGVDSTGYRAAKNGMAGVYVMGGRNTLGGTAVADRLVVSGNGGSGVELTGNKAVGNKLLGSYVGTDVTGFASVANGTGVVIRDKARDNQIGGTAAGSRNVICGNVNDQLRISGAGTTGNVVEGNHLGIDATGQSAAQEGGDAVRIEKGATKNRIGGTTLKAGNLIGGMGLWPSKGGTAGAGVSLNDKGTAGNAILGNWVGMTSKGTAPLTDRGGGIVVRGGASGNTIGGSGNARNVIADRTNAPNLSGTNNLLPANWQFDTVRYIGRPDRLGGTYRA